MLMTDKARVFKFAGRLVDVGRRMVWALALILSFHSTQFDVDLGVVSEVDLRFGNVARR